MDNHTIYTASVRQLNGLIAERDALAVALAAKQEQVAGLVAERDELRDQLTTARALAVRWRRAYCGDGSESVVFEVSSVRDDALDDDDEPDLMEDVGDSR